MILRLLLLTICLSACVQIPNVSERIDFASSIAIKKGWKPEDISTDTFTLRAYLPQSPNKSETLNVYIEGDGLAWINSSTPSFNPTPNNPLALKLALLDTGVTAYLARPCQFVDLEHQQQCSQKYWTSHRFSPEVIEASNSAVSKLKARFSANKIRLIGYSGGGAVAALVAARRDDVERLITIAGNLDHKTWTTEHHLTPLTGSLNPTDAWQQLKNTPQTHFVGSKDIFVGESIARAYTSSFISGELPIIKVITDFDHRCCWEDRWPALKDEQF